MTAKHYYFMFKDLSYCSNIRRSIFNKFRLKERQEEKRAVKYLCEKIKKKYFDIYRKFSVHLKIDTFYVLQLCLQGCDRGLNL